MNLQDPALIPHIVSRDMEVTMTKQFREEPWRMNPYIHIKTRTQPDSCEWYPLWLQHLVCPSAFFKGKNLQDGHYVQLVSEWNQRRLAAACFQKVLPFQTFENWMQLEIIDHRDYTARRSFMDGLEELVKKGVLPPGDHGNIIHIRAVWNGRLLPYHAVWADSEGAAKRFVNAVYFAYRLNVVAKSFGLSGEAPFPN